MAETKRRKGYQQACTVAAALDVVGDRWTILILRELLGGAARFRDLEKGLPGIAKNLLTERLRRLEEDGLLRRVQSASGVQYALTEHGAGVRPIIDALGTWGARAGRALPVKHRRSVRAAAVALQAILSRRGDALPSDGIVIELQIDDEPIEIRLSPRPSATARPSTDADARVGVPAEVLADFFAGEGLDRDRFVHRSGREAATEALLRALSGR